MRGVWILLGRKAFLAWVLAACAGVTTPSYGWTQNARETFAKLLDGECTCSCGLWGSLTTGVRLAWKSFGVKQVDVQKGDSYVIHKRSRAKVKRLVVIIPGIFQSYDSDTGKYLMELLAGKFHVMVFKSPLLQMYRDQQGVIPPGHFEREAAYIRATIAGVAADRAYDEVHAVGLSYGGFLAAVVVGQAQQPITGHAIMLAPPKQIGDSMVTMEGLADGSYLNPITHIVQSDLEDLWERARNAGLQVGEGGGLMNAMRNLHMRALYFDEQDNPAATSQITYWLQRSPLWNQGKISILAGGDDPICPWQETHAEAGDDHFIFDQDDAHCAFLGTKPFEAALKLQLLSGQPAAPHQGG